MNKNVSGYFDSYPTSPECFETSDGNLFHKDYDAKAHARNLESKVVTRYAAAKVEPLTSDTAVVTAVIPTKGVDAIAPVVAETTGEVISPAVGEFSTSPVAAVQEIDPKTLLVSDAGTADPDATTEVVVETPVTTDVPEEAAAAIAEKAAAIAEKATKKVATEAKKAADKK